MTVQPVQAEPGLPFEGPVATFVDPNPDGPQDAANFRATIDWGDGSSSTLTPEQYATGSATHTYADGAAGAAGSSSFVCATSRTGRGLPAK